MRPVAKRRSRAGKMPARLRRLQMAPPLGRPGFQPGLNWQTNFLEFINEFLNQGTSRLRKNSRNWDRRNGFPKRPTFRM